MPVLKSFDDRKQKFAKPLADGGLANCQQSLTRVGLKLVAELEKRSNFFLWLDVGRHTAACRVGLGRSFPSGCDIRRCG